MNSKHFYYVMSGLVTLLVLICVGVVFMADMLMQSQANKLLSAKVDNEVLETEQTILNRAKSDLEKYSELRDIAKQIVPSDKDQARTTLEIVKLASEVGVELSGITFPSSDLGDKKPSAPGAASSTGSPTSDATTTSASISQADPVKGIPGLYQLEISISSDTDKPVTYNQLIEFLRLLENNRRTSHVIGTTITPDPTNNQLINFKLDVTVYLKP